MLVEGCLVEERSEGFLDSQVGAVRGSGDVVGVVRELAGRVSGGHLRKRNHFQDVGHGLGSGICLAVFRPVSQGEQELKAWCIPT